MGFVCVLVFFFIFMHISVLIECFYEHIMHAWCLAKEEDDTGSPRTAVTDVCKQSLGAGYRTWVL